MTLDLPDLYRQLRRQVVDSQNPALIPLLAVSTLAESSRLITRSPENDQTPVWLRTKKTREKRQDHLLALGKDLEPSSHTRGIAPTGSAWFEENSRPIMVDRSVPSLRDVAPPIPSGW